MIHSVKNTLEIRSWNKKRIIEFLRLTDSVTKKELANKLNLSFATVSNLCNQLIEEGIINSRSSKMSNGGRMPEIMSITPHSRYCIILKIIETQEAEVAITDLFGETISCKRFAISQSLVFEQLVKLYCQETTTMIADLKIDYEKILGIGIAVPGIFSPNSGKLFNSTNPALENQALKAEIEKYIQLPVSIENESNLMVLATSLKNQKSNIYQDIVYIYVGEGLGTGILCNGKLVTGSHGLGGEISHMPIGSREFSCYCGKSKCIETELAQKGFLNKYYEQSKGKPLTISKETEWEEFILAVKQKKAEALNVVEENGRIFGKLISILVNLFDPETVYIGGITSPIFDFLYPYIMEEAMARQTVKDMYNLQIINSRDCEQLIHKGCSELILSGWKP